MLKLRSGALALVLSHIPLLHAQQWVELMQDPSIPFDQVRAAYDAWAGSHPNERSKGRKPFERWAWFMEPRAHASGMRPDPAVYAAAWKRTRAMQYAALGKSSANWTPLGPTSWLTSSYNPGNGRINVVAVDPNNSSIIYAGAPAGGLWRSTDNGASWNALFSDLPTLGVSGIAIDPVSGTIYTATGDGDGTDTYSMGVIKSTDNGLSWTSTGLDWQLGQVRTTNALRMHPTDPQVLFCCTSHGLWKTSDGGNVWAKVAEGRFRDVELKPGDPSIVYACTDQFFRSTDGGSTFTQVTTGLPVATDVNRMQLAVTPAAPAMVYLVCGDESDGGFLGLYRSTNSGTSFSLRSSSPNLFGYYENGTDAGGQSWYDMALAVDPANAQRVLVGGINIWRSDDGGTTWTIKSHWVHPSAYGYTHADIHHLGYQGNVLYTGSDGGLFRSTNSGDAWTDLSAGLLITQFYRLGGSPDDPSLIMAGAQDNGCNRFNGTDWTHVLGGDGMEGAFIPGEPDVIYAEMQNGAIFRSDDGGQVFSDIYTSITEDGAWVTPFAVPPTDPDALVAGYVNLWHSPDRGQTWNQLSSLAGTRKVLALACAPNDAAIMYFSNELNLYRTLNGGSSWPVVGASLPDQVITSITVRPDDASTVYVTLSGFSDGDKVFVSQDAGVTWSDVSGNLPNVPANSLALHPGSSGLYVGTDLGVFYTDSTLSNWQPYSQGLPNCVITELEVHSSSGKLRAATFGRGLWESDLYTASAAPPQAAFTTSSTSICAGDAITFHDASLEAAPGWNWQFPGGTPATSTDAAPTVTYPSAGTYSATLTVTNSFGSDSHTATFTISVLPNPVSVTVALDNYPNETSWTITNDLTGQAVANGGPYTGHEDLSTEQSTVCLPQGCYTFTISDSYGDGICCGQGNGSYTVTNPQLGTIASGGSFTSSESTPFCVSIGMSAPALPRPSLDVWPLDAEGRYALGLEADLHTGYSIVVLDAVGRTVLERSVRSPRLVREPIDLHPFGAGLYTVSVRNGAHTWSARLIRP